MRNNDVCIQFTGGKDSTLLAMLMAEQFENIHLITFYNHMIIGIEKASLNIEKLQKKYEDHNFKHSIIDNEDLLKHLYTSRWFQDIKNYRTYAANNICSSCRLAMVCHTIVYCHQRGISHVRDGANRTGFDLSQQVWSLDLLKKLYGEYNIDYDCCLYDNPRSDIDLLKFGLMNENPRIFYRSQPLCRGAGEVHNIYFRFYFLPKYGRDARIERDLQWLNQRLEICREWISGKISQASERLEGTPNTEHSIVRSSQS